MYEYYAIGTVKPIWNVIGSKDYFENDYDIGNDCGDTNFKLEVFAIASLPMWKRFNVEMIR